MNPSKHYMYIKILKHFIISDSLTRLELGSGEQVAVILNNLGGTSKLEELIVAREELVVPSRANPALLNV